MKLFLTLLITVSVSLFAAEATSKKADAKKTESYQEMKDRYNGMYPNIEHAELKKLIAEKKVTLVDANGPDVYKETHIPTAIDGSMKDLATKLPKDKKSLLVAYCGSENCTAWMKTADQLKEMGYTNIKHYSAGIKGWNKTETVAKKG